ncbi:uncharacterized protein LOC128208617 [Mya arenaria]|uniref:uncharacterized protein LOC128208617 n=1 Tax=Mya arenaria TaxID=6604 RepID=UPI0022E0EB5A|nr:uncharacterized protein LOC128208617 [Mya arenaria]
MEDPPEFYRIMSLRLSRALGEIGVNSWMVRKRRRTFLMLEAEGTISGNLQGFNSTKFFFGSQSEGTTTPGLNSDVDILNCEHDINIMTALSEWTAGMENYLMIKEEKCSPQHYLLQEIRQDSPEPAVNPSNMFSVVDINGRVLHANTEARFIMKLISEGTNLPYYSSGPSHSVNKMFDMVKAYRRRSLPPECLEWFERPRPGHWPPPGLFREVRECGCFLVPDGHFDSLDKDVEWRISPSLIERTLMFSMKTLQLKCYVVLKILKSHFINPCLNNIGKLTSFHCKTALFFAAEGMPPGINILSLFESSLHSDVASSRLKLVSFFFCHNELERAADVLNDVERRYDDSVQAVCGCGNMDPFKTEHHKPLCTTSVLDNDDVLLTNKTALCVRYLGHEASCAPPILRYEMVRGIGEDINHRNLNEQKWMKWAVVDALPYLYYLQYLTFRGLGQRVGRLQAIINLGNCILDNSSYSQIYHEATFGNLLGALL